MAEIEFSLNNSITVMKCNLEEKIKNICLRYSEQIKKDINLLSFIYDSKILNKNSLELPFNELANNTDKERKKNKSHSKGYNCQSKRCILP